MKILLFSSNSPYREIIPNSKSIGGAEINLRLIAEELAYLGNKVYYYSNKKGLSIKRNINDVSTYHVHIYYIPFLHKYLSFIRKFNEKFIILQQKKHIETIIKNKKIDLIHTYSTYPDTFAAVNIAKKYNIPVVQRIVGRAWYNLLKNNKKLKEKIKWTFKNVDLLLFISDFIKKQTFTYFDEFDFKINTACAIADIGINFNQLKKINIKKLKSKYNLSDFEDVILCVASFKYYSKRQDILIKSVPNLIKKFDNLRIIFLGEGPTLTDMRKIANDLKVSNKISFLGTVPHLDALAMISYAKVIAHPTDFEGYSNILKETLALGKPLVISDIPPLNGFITDGYNGILVENNSKMFSEKIIYLLDNDKIRESIENNAYKYAKDLFDSKKNILIYKKIFLDLISNKK